VVHVGKQTTKNGRPNTDGEAPAQQGGEILARPRGQGGWRAGIKEKLGDGDVFWRKTQVATGGGKREKNRGGIAELGEKKRGPRTSLESVKPPEPSKEKVNSENGDRRARNTQQSHAGKKKEKITEYKNKRKTKKKKQEDRGK